MSKGVHKTNAMRRLDSLKVSYQVLEYDVRDGKLDGLSVAKKVGRSPETLFKTLVTWSRDHNLFVFIIPVGEELDLKKAAAAAQEKSLEMIPQAKLLPLTGYVHGGCSPIGMKKSFPTWIHVSASDLETMGVSGGKIGLQILLAPQELASAADAHFADIIKKT